MLDWNVLFAINTYQRRQFYGWTFHAIVHQQKLNYLNTTHSAWLPNWSDPRWSNFHCKNHFESSIIYHKFSLYNQRTMQQCWKSRQAPTHPLCPFEAELLTQCIQWHPSSLQMFVLLDTLLDTTNFSNWKWNLFYLQFRELCVLQSCKWHMNLTWNHFFSSNVHCLL